MDNISHHLSYLTFNQTQDIINNKIIYLTSSSTKHTIKQSNL